MQPDGSSRLTYQIGAENVGPTLIQNVTLVDNLATAFAGASVNVVSIGLGDAPGGFGATANTAFNGESNTSLLTTGGDLPPGETVTVDLVIDVQSVTGGTYTNTVTAGGQRPNGTGTPITESEAEVDAVVQHSLPLSRWW